MGLNQSILQYEETLAFGGIIAASVLVVVVICFAIYKLCLDDDDDGRHQYSSLANDSGPVDIPRDFLNDEESLMHLADTYDFTHLSPEEQSGYLKAKEFTQQNPPNYHHTRGKSFTIEDDAIIEDRGINAYYFDQEDIVNPRFIVGDRTEIDFMNNDAPYSTATAVLNYALPVKNRNYSDTVYFETKIFEYFETPNSHFSIGLVTKPYPSSFRLPGYNSFSIGYESTGNLKINKPFPTPLQQHQGERSEFNALVLPPLVQSDIVGFGYVVSTGTIFITRNGKKVLDVMKGCFVDMYPAIGCFSTNAKFQVNLGQMGFVWIEANVRKYGFVSTSDHKKLAGERGLAALPEYYNADTDKILDKGEELPPKYPDEELDFFGRSMMRESSSKHHSAPQNKPLSSFNSEKDELDIQEEKDKPTKSMITNEPEEIMDLRERIYEQNIQNVNEFTPLVGSTPDANSESTLKQDKIEAASKLIDSNEIDSSIENELQENNLDTNETNEFVSSNDSDGAGIESHTIESQSNNSLSPPNTLESKSKPLAISSKVSIDQQTQNSEPRKSEESIPIEHITNSEERLADSSINVSDSIPKDNEPVTNVDHSTVEVAGGQSTAHMDETQASPSMDKPSSKENSPSTSSTKKKKKNLKKKKKKGKKK